MTEPKDPLVPRVPLVIRVLLVNRVTRVTLDQKDPLAIQVQRVRLVQRV